MRNIAKCLLAHGRVQNLPFQQYPSYTNNMAHSGNNATRTQGNVAAKDRYNGIFILLINGFDEWTFFFHMIMVYKVLYVPPLSTLAEKCHLIHLHADQAQNHPLGNQTEKITAKEIAPRMMSLTRWTQVLTQMLHGVAGT